MAMEALVLYGLLAVFILIFLDGALLMPGFPGELVLIIYITLFQPDFLTLVVLVGIGVAATLLSAIPLYYIGRATAKSMEKKKKRVFGMSPKTQERMQRLFSRPAGGVILVIARLFLPTRAIVSVPAGIARMPFMRFMVLSAVGTVLFFVGYIWLIYQFQNPESQVSQTHTALDQAYLSPAWTLVEANWIAAILALIVLGIVLSIRASRRMAREAHETSGSIIGFIVRTSLLWGGAVLFIAVWINNVAVYEALAFVGIDPLTLTLGIPGEPDTLIAGVALLAFIVGASLNGMRRRAREKNRILRLEEEKLAFQKRLPEQLAETDEHGFEQARVLGHTDATTAHSGTAPHRPVGPRRHPLVRRARGETEGEEEATTDHEETLRSRDTSREESQGA